MLSAYANQGNFMSTDNKLIAAHLTAALIAQTALEHFTSQAAVDRFNEVLALLDKQDDKQQQEGIDGFLMSPNSMV